MNKKSIIAAILFFIISANNLSAISCGCSRVVGKFLIVVAYESSGGCGDVSKVDFTSGRGSVSMSNGDGTLTTFVADGADPNVCFN
ncbi:MAG: hypothetical protein EAZ06_11430 [Cytophagales bacterium]|nr:MAG: hypothetical protein EAZ06_11430 [Cytophagales bacterium]